MENMVKTADSHVLKVEHLQTGYGKKIISSDLSLTIPDHKISVIIGSNGCGKSTLLKTLSRLLPPIGGEITLDGKHYHSYLPKKFARKIGLLPQSPVVPEGVKVSDLIARGRFPYLEPFRGMTKEDYAAVDEAMEMMGVTEFADRNVDELSGGQRQRVWIAMALAQQPDILYLDEPTTNLAFTNQVDILDLLSKLYRERKTTIVMVLHDLNLSARYADCLFALKDGNLVAAGEPTDVLTRERVEEVFGLPCMVMADPLSGAPMVIPQGRYHCKEQ